MGGRQDVVLAGGYARGRVVWGNGGDTGAAECTHTMMLRVAVGCARIAQVMAVWLVEGCRRSVPMAAPNPIKDLSPVLTQLLRPVRLGGLLALLAGVAFLAGAASASAL